MNQSYKTAGVINPHQHAINKKEFENHIDRAARGYDFAPNMKGHSYIFCVFMWFFRELTGVNSRLEKLENALHKDSLE